ncbi:hypothetical protein [Microbacterium sp. B24]|uniref:hypothetical protein n=1 Tax=Microbacterium sp. B24 TaxID=95616 RepID=UPI0019552B24|nr:hypothetical protein [Microbacterium sp. B24]
MNTVRPDHSGSDGSGSDGTPLTAATVIAGAIGYVIQAAVPGFVATADYVAFSIYWSAVYLIVGAISGVQQEVTRAARQREMGPRATGTLFRFTLGSAGVFAVAIVASSPLWATAAFGAATGLVGPLAVAAVAYTFVAALSGVFYGARHWRGAAGMTITDSTVRLITIGIALALGGGIILLGWAVAVPFALAAVSLWFAGGRRAVEAVELDVPLRRMWRNSFSTVGAALATGVMISGLPLLLGLTSRGLGETDLAAVILVTTLTRAPLVVPMLALQSYLLVTFRDAPERAAQRTAIWGAMLMCATALLAVLGALIGPWIIDLLYQGRYALEPAMFAVIIAGAGLTALLSLTGAAALAAGDHLRYVIGWAASSTALVVGLIAVPAGMWTVIGAVALAPVVGIAVHVSSLRRQASRSRK